MPRPLLTSSYLRTIPAMTGSSVTITPSSYTSWAACMSGNMTKQDFRVGPGDYTSWGVLDIRNKSGGFPGAYRSFRYVGPNDHLHPAQRAERALITRFD